jgi:hypothetical protein
MNLPGWDWKENILKPNAEYITSRADFRVSNVFVQPVSVPIIMSGFTLSITFDSLHSFEEVI